MIKLDCVRFRVGAVHVGGMGLEEAVCKPVRVRALVDIKHKMHNNYVRDYIINYVKKIIVSSCQITLV